MNAIVLPSRIASVWEGPIQMSRTADGAGNRGADRAYDRDMTQVGSPGSRQETAEGREALLDATVRVVARDGFDGLTYRSVGEEAGCTHGLVSYHFGNREKLIHEAAQRASARAVKSADLVPEGDDPTDFVRDLASSMEHDLDSHMFQYELTLQSRRRPAIGRDMRTLYDGYCDLTRQALRKMGIDANPALARVVFAAVDGIVLQQVVSEDPQRTEESLAELHRLLELLLDPSES